MKQNRIKARLRQVLERIIPIKEFVASREFHRLHERYMALSDQLINFTKSVTAIMREQTDAMARYTQRLGELSRDLDVRPQDESLWNSLQDARRQHEAAMRAFDERLRPLAEQAEALQAELRAIEHQQEQLKAS